MDSRESKQDVTLETIVEEYDNTSWKDLKNARIEIREFWVDRIRHLEAKHKAELKEAIDEAYKIGNASRIMADRGVRSGGAQLIRLRIKYDLYK